MPDHTLTVRIEDGTDPRVTAAIEAELRRRVDAIRDAQDAAVVRYLRSFADEPSRRHADRIEAGHHRAPKTTLGPEPEWVCPYCMASKGFFVQRGFRRCCGEPGQ